ncbi:hypothetical protein, partial [Pseudomonas caricapapayae]
FPARLRPVTDVALCVVSNIAIKSIQTVCAVKPMHEDARGQSPLFEQTQKSAPKGAFCLQR